MGPPSLSERIRATNAAIEEELARNARLTMRQAELKLKLSTLKAKLEEKHKIRMELLQGEADGDFVKGMQFFAKSITMISELAQQKHKEDVKGIILNYYRDAVIPWDDYRGRGDPDMRDEEHLSEFSDFVKKNFPLPPETMKTMQDEHAQAKADLAHTEDAQKKELGDMKASDLPLGQDAGSRTAQREDNGWSLPLRPRKHGV